VPTVKVTFEDQAAMRHTISIPCTFSEDAETISEKLTAGSLKIVNTEDNARLRHISPLQSRIHIPFSLCGGVLFSLLATPVVSPSPTVSSSASAVAGLFCLFVGILLTAMISIFFSDVQGNYQTDYPVSPTQDESSLKDYCTENTVYTNCMITPEFDGETLTLLCSDLQGDLSQLWVRRRKNRRLGDKRINSWTSSVVFV
jgi:hypothetical protein